jgi:flagellar motor switch protein FliN/FliY
MDATPSNDEGTPVEPPASTAEEVKAPAAAAATAEMPISQALGHLEGVEAEPSNLPEHARHLLDIRVPVRVTLASQRKSIQEIIELGPGTIVKFDKTYDEPMELMVGNRSLALGEVVKVGDKFGLRIRGLVK